MYAIPSSLPAIGLNQNYKGHDMNNKLRSAIEGILTAKTVTKNLINDLKMAYLDTTRNRTETMKRIEFLENCLSTGMTKRAAAKELVAHDPRINRRTAETIVYTVFSGMYQKERKSMTLGIPFESPSIPIDTDVTVKDDEDLL